MIPAEKAHLRVAAGTHEGMRGKNNEDLFSVTAYSLSETRRMPVVFAVVADGIGGHLAGEKASEIAVEMISEAVAQSDGSQPTGIMEAAIIQASETILAQAEADEKKQGMGTTAVCVWVIGDRLYSAAVGNSRIYLLRDGKMTQINIDHTWVQEAVEAGALTPRQARVHPHANIIRRYLGSKNPVEVDLRLRLTPGDISEESVNNQGTRLKPGDRLLLCSDGLNDMVEDEDIQELAEQEDLDKSVQDLIDKANENGGKDNITVVLLEMPPINGMKLPTVDLKSPVQMGVLIGSGLLIGLAVLVGLGWMGYKAFLAPTPTPTATTPANTPTMAMTATPLPTDTPTETLAPKETMSPTQTYTSIPTSTTEGEATPIPPEDLPAGSETDAPSSDSP